MSCHVIFHISIMIKFCFRILIRNDECLVPGKRNDEYSENEDGSDDLTHFPCVISK